MPARILRENRESFAFDVEESFVPTRDFDVTLHPVEKGSDATDHHRLRSEILTMSGTISDTPGHGSTFELDADNRPQLARAWLGALEGEFVDVVHSEMGVWEDCLLLRDGGPRGRLMAYDMTISLRQVQTPSRQRVQLPPLAVQEQVKVGEQAPAKVEVDEEQAESVYQSLAHRLIG